MVTIYDVAAQAGVSPATVSRVFNGIKVSPERAEAVKLAADALGFVPNRNARRLRTSSSEIIAMMVPDIENPFFTTMTRAVEDVARAESFSVMLCNTDEDPVREQEYLRAAVSDPVAGIIIVPSSRASRLDVAIERGVPVVCVDRHVDGPPVDTVVSNSFDGGAAATRQLFRAGYLRVACISGPEGTETADQRAAGWEQTFHQVTGRYPASELLIRAPYTFAGGEAAMRSLLAMPQPPDAILAANNRIASGALRVLAEAGRLPPEVGLLSFGGLPFVLLAPVEVMVAHVPAKEMGLTAARMLLERIQGRGGPAREVVLPVTVGEEGIELSLNEAIRRGAATAASIPSRSLLALPRTSG